MKVALISDIHGNLAALEAVLADLERDGPDRIVCLGDVAATGPQPRETVERLRALGCPAVMGNADAELLGPMPQTEGDGDGVGDVRRIEEIDRWCAGQLSPADLDYLRGFPLNLEVSLGSGHSLLCFPGSPRSFDDAIQVTTPEDELGYMFSGHDAAVMAGGHTHVQLLRRHAETTVLNPGSVGLNPPWAEYALISYEDGSLRVEMRRLPLTGEAIVRAAAGSGMPHAGWWAGFWG